MVLQNNSLKHKSLYFWIRNITFRRIQLTPTNIKFYISLQYFGKQSEKLKHELTLLLNQYFSNISFHLILNNSHKLSTFFSYKDKLPKGMLSSVIYKYSYAYCASEYIGSTNRVLKLRVAEHAGRSFRTNRQLTNTPNSNIYDHTNDCNSHININ